VRTQCPAFKSCRMVWLAMKPEPPVTKTTMGFPRFF
jgi:hypothetical protein